MELGEQHATNGTSWSFNSLVGQDLNVWGWGGGVGGASSQSVMDRVGVHLTAAEVPEPHQQWLRVGLDLHNTSGQMTRSSPIRSKYLGCLDLVTIERGHISMVVCLSAGIHAASTRSARRSGGPVPRPQVFVRPGHRLTAHSARMHDANACVAPYLLWSMLAHHFCSTGRQLILHACMGDGNVCVASHLLCTGPSFSRPTNFTPRCKAIECGDCLE